jgi:hypothetical protein
LHGHELVLLFFLSMHVVVVFVLFFFFFVLLVARVLVFTGTATAPADKVGLHPAPRATGRQRLRAEQVLRVFTAHRRRSPSGAHGWTRATVAALQAASIWVVQYACFSLSHSPGDARACAK